MELFLRKYDLVVCSVNVKKVKNFMFVFSDELKWCLCEVGVLLLLLLVLYLFVCLFSYNE